ncbi:TM2 domain-containing protein [Microlunatus panaciterrae]|uniref:TM2 domain-containing protein n=1 Tax=Microlunatus panaciterrae TaxID=400768 RepID=A0ABS2RK60_9ACTN|nr:TM2 domain-containing protein [Microlunatus panaciterrae]MBM7799389.1 hypothetical protein [Microlunatus panaciterrae]
MGEFVPEPVVYGPQGRQPQPSDYPHYPLRASPQPHPAALPHPPYQVSPYQVSPYQVSPYQGDPYHRQPYQGDPRQQQYQNGLYAAQKSRLAAGLLAFFLGTLGIHNFYLGRVGIAVLQLLLSVLSFGLLAPVVAVWVIIEGILILTRSPSFATDAKGIPLRD